MAPKKGLINVRDLTGPCVVCAFFAAIPGSATSLLLIREFRGL
jgi:hypothetical protein